ncbi:MAG: DUF4397 domain-containing protein [Geodermatophilaceae bacterium]|nr:DUF4397 domain-containing protein [Geodermatophilaceae bacterium]
MGLRAGLAVVGVTVLGVLAVGLTPAAAADGAFLRLAHLSPDTPEVDVYVVSVSDPADTIVLEGVGYGAVSEYQTVSGGTYTISMRPAGAAASTPPVISTTLNTSPGNAYTVAGVGVFDDLGLTVLDDDLTLPPAGQSRVRVVQASASEPELDISVDGGPTLGTDVAFATTTGYTTVPPGNWTLRVDGTAGLAATLPLTVEAGGVYSVLVLDDSSGGLTVVTRVDAASSGTVPVGSVETGAGGTAARPAGSLGLLAGATMLVVAGTLAGRRRAALR